MCEDIQILVLEGSAAGRRDPASAYERRFGGKGHIEIWSLGKGSLPTLTVAIGDQYRLLGA